MFLILISINPVTRSTTSRKSQILYHCWTDHIEAVKDSITKTKTFTKVVTFVRMFWNYVKQCLFQFWLIQQANQPLLAAKHKIFQSISKQPSIKHFRKLCFSQVEYSNSYYMVNFIVSGPSSKLHMTWQPMSAMRFH